MPAGLSAAPRSPRLPRSSPPWAKAASRLYCAASAVSRLRRASVPRWRRRRRVRGSDRRQPPRLRLAPRPCRRCRLRDAVPRRWTRSEDLSGRHGDLMHRRQCGPRQSGDQQGGDRVDDGRCQAGRAALLDLVCEAEKAQLFRGDRRGGSRRKEDGAFMQSTRCCVGRTARQRFPGAADHCRIGRPGRRAPGDLAGGRQE